MGRQARIKRDRAIQRRQYAGVPMKREPFQIINSLHQSIQGHCHENSRRCWEYLVEMLAMTTGWRTETDESKALWEPMRDEPRWAEFVEAWVAEVAYAKKNNLAFSEPLGELLEHIEGTNHHWDQYFTPMQVVHAMNEMTFSDQEEETEGYIHGLDPCCGTGRFMLDALVFNDRLIMGSVDLDPWLMRTAKLNARILANWTTLHEKTEYWDAMLAGRARFIWGDALVVDLRFSLNWLLSWYWTPKPWQSDLKVSGFPGTYDQWLDAGKPDPNSKAQESDNLQFDYSMEDPTKPTAPEGRNARKYVRTKLAGSPFAKSSERSRTSSNPP